MTDGWTTSNGPERTPRGVGGNAAALLVLAGVCALVGTAMPLGDVVRVAFGLATVVLLAVAAVRPPPAAPSSPPPAPRFDDDGTTTMEVTEVLPARDAFIRDASPIISEGAGVPAVLVLEIVGFRDVETVLGDRLAEQVLVEVAERITAVAGDWPVGALGGEQFAVAMRAHPFLPAHHVARSLREAISKPLEIGGVQLRLSAAVGVAQAEDAVAPEPLIRRAGIAAGRALSEHDGVRIHKPEDPGAVRRRLAIVTGLSDAMESPDERNFQIAYQPIVDAGGALSTAEALSRWRDPVLGEVTPDVFIPLAEQTGLIAPLFNYVLRFALMDCRRWQDAGVDAGVSVNLSAVNLREPVLLSKLSSALDYTGIASKDVTIEITETAVITDPGVAMRVLKELRRAGFKVAIDDFGVGHSSLSRLRDLPVDVVKLDKSFTKPLPEDARSRAVVEASVAVAKALGLEVVAEGVERDAQADMLLSMGADRLQGFLFSKAVTVEELMGEDRQVDSDQRDGGNPG